MKRNNMQSVMHNPLKVVMPEVSGSLQQITVESHGSNVTISAGHETIHVDVEQIDNVISALQELKHRVWVGELIQKCGD